MSNLVYVFLADGFETVEALAPVDILRRGGVEVYTVSITDSEYVESAQKVIVKADKKYSDISVDDADMLVLPGGMPGTLNLKAFKPLCDKVVEFNKEGKIIAAICAAPTVFGSLGLLEGKKAICYPGMEDGLTGAFVTVENVVEDGNIITSRGMGTAVPFGIKLLERFNKEAASGMAEKIVY